MIPIGFMLLLKDFSFIGMLVVNSADGLAFGFIVYSAVDCLKKLKFCDRVKYLEFSE